VVKVRRPGVAEQVALDLDVLRTTVRFLHKRSETAQLLQLEALMDELGVHLRAELDLREEAHNTKVVGRAIADFQELLVATVVDPHVTEEVLVLERIQGER
jgi:ubiquinone biosynthesis protein